MGIRRLNHAVLYVRDAELSASFYRQVLGFVEVSRMSLGASLQTGLFLRGPESENDHDLALFGLGERLGPSSAGTDQVGLYHLAWEVRTLSDLTEIGARMQEAGALIGRSDHTTSKAIYGSDPDGLEFEVCWVVPPSLLREDEPKVPTVHELDLPATIARFGADTPGLGYPRT